MLTIRGAQLAALGEAASKQFELELVSHLKQFAPRTSQIIGQQGLEQTVRLGLGRAANYGFTKRGPLRLYVELMSMFGSYFDTDPSLPWASTVLSQPAEDDEMLRAERLHEQTLNYLRHVAGENNRYTVAALRRAKDLRFEDYPRSPGTAVGSWGLSGLKLVYPERCAHVGDQPLRLLIRSSVKEAAVHNVITDHGVAVILALMFSFGHGCTNDPLYPWVTATLRDGPAVQNRAELADRLHARARIYLQKALDYLEMRNAHVPS